MMIDPVGPVPVYRQVADIIADQIRSGELTAHQRIPTEKELMDLYGIARETARKATNVLREDGWVYTVGGRGTYVSPRE